MFRKKINSTYGIIKAAVSLLLVISLTGCSLSGGDKKAENTKAPASTVKQAEVKTLSKEDAFAKAAQYLKNMSVEQKVGQLFVVNLEQLDSSKGSYYEWKKCSKKMKEAIKKNSIGGVIMFSRNIGKRKQTKKLIREIQKAADIPAFVTVDEEGGEVARIAGNPDMKTTKYPSMEDVGKKKDADYVNNMGETIGNDIKKLGFTFGNFRGFANLESAHTGGSSHKPIKSLPLRGFSRGVEAPPPTCTRKACMPLALQAFSGGKAAYWTFPDGNFSLLLKK